jgi:hypothetical protein
VVQNLADDCKRRRRDTVSQLLDTEDVGMPFVTVNRSTVK